MGLIIYKFSAHWGFRLRIWDFFITQVGKFLLFLGRRSVFSDPQPLIYVYELSTNVWQMVVRFSSLEIMILFNSFVLLLPLVDQSWVFFYLHWKLFSSLSQLKLKIKLQLAGFVMRLRRDDFTAEIAIRGCIFKPVEIIGNAAYTPERWNELLLTIFVGYFIWPHITFIRKFFL